jgi:hypothetical protein
MSTRFLAPFRSRLTILYGSRSWRASSPFFSLRACATQTAFHVQLAYRCLSSAWESFFSCICLPLNSKSNSSILLRTA